MNRQIQAIRGMKDILPHDSPAWRFLEQTIHEVLDGYGYQEIRTPIVEESALFSRAIGEVTDIVEKEMYTFTDRNGENLTLRPEGTAGCVRAMIEHGLLHNRTQRVWYYGPMFRHERPQRGRYRQFYQIGVEAFGLSGPDIDAELIMMTARLWERLGIRQDVTLQLNSLGTPAARSGYRVVLVEYLRCHADQLDEDSRRRLDTNPLRILDSKNPALAEVIANAPKLDEHLDEESRHHFEQLCGILAAVGIDYLVNPRLVRGLDYYSKTVFEWVTDKLGAQGTICAGGRFDGLVEQLGGKPTPAVGCAMGMERLGELIEPTTTALERFLPQVYLVRAGDTVQTAGLMLAERLRTDLPWLRLQVDHGAGSVKSQFRKADKSGARIALILGENEMAKGCVGVKCLRGEAEQQTVNYDALVQLLTDQLAQTV